MTASSNPQQSDRDYMLNAIREHAMIRIYRRSNGAARLANDLAVEGLVEMRIVQTDEQSSHMEVTLAKTGKDGRNA